MSSNTKPLHFLLIPFMEQGHMIPMIDLARLLAARGILVTFITTPVNLARIRPIVDRAAASALPIRFVELDFPVADAGLPNGCESVDFLPTSELMLPFLYSVALLRGPLESYLRNSDPSPDCLISDNLHYWTADVARSLGIPRLIFHGPSCFFLHCNLLVHRHFDELEAAIEASPTGSTVLPNLPRPIRVGKREVINIFRSDPDWFRYMETLRVVEESADGVLVNSFAELEPRWFENYGAAIGKPVWPVGPLSLYKEGVEAKAARGGASSVDADFVLGWLEKQEVGSVVLVSFGSLVRNTMGQVAELGRGLEASGRPFIWVVKELEGEEWMAEFEERVGGRGIVIRGWAPQAVILGHAAVGGFVTHCGWNSTIEAVAMGVVVGTWPSFYDQFFNEILVVEVLGIGVAVGEEKKKMIGVDGVVGDVSGEEVERFLERLMGGGEEGEKRRERAKELGEKARMAMEENGSSWKGLQDVIDYVFERQTNVLREEISIM